MAGKGGLGFKNSRQGELRDWPLSEWETEGVGGARRSKWTGSPTMDSCGSSCAEALSPLARAILPWTPCPPSARGASGSIAPPPC